MAMSPNKMGAAIVRNLESRTGKDLASWVRVAKSSKLRVLRDLRAWLKAEHGLGATTCYIIADAALGRPKGEPTTDKGILAHQFRDGRKALRPLYDALVKAVHACGKEATVGVRRTQTTFARGHTFAIAKGPTLSRIDLGLRLPGVKPTKRLEATTAFSDNATHCVRLNQVGDVDAKLKAWLKLAYDKRG